MRFSLFAAAALAACLAASDIYAQRIKQPRPLATPPVLTGAEIISRGGSFEDGQEVAKDNAKPAPRTSPTPTNTERLTELLERVKRLERQQTAPAAAGDDKQKALLMNLEIIARAEQRAEALRKQLFEMIEKESSIKTRLEQIDLDSRPEMIERNVQIAGSLRPEDVRESRRRSLAAEKTNLQSLLTEIQNARGNLAAALQRADLLVEKLRIKLEKDIDDALEAQQPDIN